MKTIQLLHRVCLLLCTVLIIACSTDQEPLQSTDTRLTKATYTIAPKTTYPDSVLLQVLNEELALTHKGNYGEISDTQMLIDKSNPKKVYVHYMPWFQSKPYDGYWGQHWTMTNRNPDNQRDGVQDIASFYNPLIGAYSSSDPYLQEYHFLLMKLCGVDGVIFDWYGSRDINDYGLIKQATESFIPRLENVGLGFSVMYEDRVAYLGNEAAFITPVERVKSDFEYIRDTYFKSEYYLEFNNAKYISIFGPQYINTADDWDDIYGVFDTNEQPFLVSLWGTKAHLGNAFKGEFLWVSEDHLAAKDYYYDTYASFNNITIGSAYPGFASFYEEGGWTEGINTWVLPKYDGLTFVESLNTSSKAKSDFIQIITWNDFGEGTMIEPTTQFGFTYLEMLQQYTGVAYTKEDLKICVRLYNTRLKFRDNKKVMRLLNICFNYFKIKRLRRVDKLLQAINWRYSKR